MLRSIISIFINVEEKDKRDSFSIESKNRMLIPSKVAQCFTMSPLFSQLISLVFQLCHLGWPNPTPHFCPIGEGRYSTTAVAARSISKCSHDFRVHPTPPIGPWGAWGRSCIPFGSWRIFIYNNKGMKLSRGILLCSPTSILTIPSMVISANKVQEYLSLGSQDSP